MPRGCPVKAVQLKHPGGLHAKPRRPMTGLLNMGEIKHATGCQMKLRAAPSDFARYTMLSGFGWRATQLQLGKNLIHEFAGSC
jgi:hypothetical protein